LRLFLLIAPPPSARVAIYTYDIPAGGLEEALNRFATQAGIRVSFDTEEVKGKTAQALIFWLTLVANF
jgi:hypothetical protein